MDTFYQRATQMILSSEARQASDLSKEPDKLRDEYGRDGRWGAQALLSRRLLEAGVRFVLLSYSAWDHHAKIFEACDKALPGFDKAVALLQDMKRRGSARRHAGGDVRRSQSSKINKDAGRDHWGNVA